MCKMHLYGRIQVIILEYASITTNVARILCPDYFLTSDGFLDQPQTSLLLVSFVISLLQRR